LKERCHLRGIRKLAVEELVAMFLNTLGHGFGNRIVQEMFQHLGKTVSRHFNCVLMAISRMTIDIINPIDREFRNVPRKFMMMSGIGHTSKIVLEPLMKLMYQLKFFH
jgi:DNA repair protein RadC